MKPIETKRLLIRPFILEDSAFVLRLLNEPTFIANIVDKGVRTLEQAAVYLSEGPINSYQRHGHGLYLVALKESRQPIGMCGLIKRDCLQHADLGYALLPEFCSMGYAFESASAVMDYAHTILGFTTTQAIVNPGNVTSIKLLNKLKFTFSATMLLPPDSDVVSLFEHHQSLGS